MAGKMGPSHLGFERKFEAQRPNNFEIFIYGVEGEDVLNLSVDSGFLPSESSEEVVLGWGNRNVKVAGKTNFDTGSLVLKDAIEADTEAIIARWRALVSNPLTDQIGWADQYKKEGRIVQYSPDGTVERSWIIQGCWPSAVNYGSLDYNTSDKKTIEVTLSYDLAFRELKTSNPYAAAVGTLV